MNPSLPLRTSVWGWDPTPIRGMRWGERGSTPIWFLGLAMMVLMLGAVSFELWRLLGDRQQLAAAADAAAVAGSSEIDLDLYRATGEVALDPGPAEDRAAAVVDVQTVGASLYLRDIEATPERIEVTLGRRLPFWWIRLLALEGDEFEVIVTAVAYPVSP